MFYVIYRGINLYSTPLHNGNSIDIMDTEDFIVERHDRDFIKLSNISICNMTMGFIWFAEVTEAVKWCFTLESDRLLFFGKVVLAWKMSPEWGLLMYGGGSGLILSIAEFNIGSNKCENILIQFVEKLGKYYRVCLRFVFNAADNKDVNREFVIAVILDDNGFVGTDYAEFKSSIFSYRVYENRMIDKVLRAKLMLAGC